MRLCIRLRLPYRSNTPSNSSWHNNNLSIVFDRFISVHMITTNNNNFLFSAPGARAPAHTQHKSNMCAAYEHLHVHGTVVAHTIHTFLIENENRQQQQRQQPFIATCTCAHRRSLLLFRIMPMDSRLAVFFFIIIKPASVSSGTTRYQSRNLRSHTDGAHTY